MKWIYRGLVLFMVAVSCQASPTDSLRLQQRRSTAVTQGLVGLSFFAIATVAFCTAQPWTNEANELEEDIEDLPSGLLKDEYKNIVDDYRGYARKINNVGYICGGIGVILEFLAVTNVIARAPYAVHAQAVKDGGKLTLAVAF